MQVSKYPKSVLEEMKKSPGEKFLNIPGFPLHIWVTNKGRVFSSEYIISGHRKLKRKARFMSMHIGTHGYLQTNLTVNKKNKTYKVHRLVCIAFLPKDPERNVVNHVDGNKRNNKLENLEWCTYKENTAHSIAIGSFSRCHVPGEKNGLSKLKSFDVPIIREALRKGYTAMSIASYYKVHISCISRVGLRQTWKHIP